LFASWPIVGLPNVRSYSKFSTQCFVATGDTVGNPSATKTGNTVTCHRAATSRREALPGAWEAGVCLTAGAEANQYAGTPSQKRRRHCRWLGSRDDYRLPRITGPCDRAPAARDHQLVLTSERKLAQGRPLRHRLSFNSM
jgi:hypothetical protein